MYECFTVGEYAFFATFLYNRIHTKSIKNYLVASIFVFAVFGFVFPLFRKEVIIDSVPIGVETILILIFSFYYLYEQMNDTTTLFIYSTFPFWMVIGIVIYLSGNFFTYIFADSLSKGDVNKYWVITNIFSMLRTIFFCIGIIVNSKPPTKIPPSEFRFSSLN